MFAGSFAPAGWMFCVGQLLPISENDTLFNLIGTTYGGDGQETFGLPNLASRVPIHAGTAGGSTYIIGESGGTEQETLSVQKIPIHSHPAVATAGSGSSISPANAVLAAPTSAQSGVKTYGLDTPLVSLSNQALQPAGGSQPHDNMQPFLCISFIISLFGIYPSQN